MFLAAAVTTAAIVWLLVTSHHIRVHQSLSSLRRCHSNLRSAIGPPTVSLSLTSALKLHCHGILVVVRHVRPQLRSVLARQWRDEVARNPDRRVRSLKTSVTPVVACSNMCGTTSRNPAWNPPPLGNGDSVSWLDCHSLSADSITVHLGRTAPGASTTLSASASWCWRRASGCGTNSLAALVRMLLVFVLVPGRLR